MNKRVHDVVISLRIDDALLGDVDALAGSLGVSRSCVLRLAVVHCAGRSTGAGFRAWARSMIAGAAKSIF